MQRQRKRNNKRKKVRLKEQGQVKANTKESNPFLTSPMNQVTSVAEGYATPSHVTESATMKDARMSLYHKNKRIAPWVVAAISGIRLAIVLGPVSLRVGKDAERGETGTRKATTTDLRLW